MSQTLFRNILLLVFVNLIIKPFWILGIDLQVQNIVGSAEYGVYYALFNFSFLLHILLDIGINQYNNREIARFPDKVTSMFTNLLVLKGLFAFVYFGLTFLGAYLAGFKQFELKWLIFLALNQMFLSIVLYARSNFTALRWFNLDVFFSVLDRLISIILCVILIYAPFFKGSFSIQYFIYAQTIALAISAFFSISVLIFKIEIKMPDWNWKNSYKLIKQSFPYALAILMMSMYTRVDAVMIERLLPITGAYETGIYAASYRLLDSANMIPFLFATILIPVFSRNLEYKEEYKPLLYGSLQSLLFLSSLVTIIVVFWGNEILSLLYKDADVAWYYTFVFLMATFNAVCFNYVFGGFLTAAGKLWFIIKFSFIALFLNIVLNFFLIKSNGAAGAAIATIATQIFMAIAQTSKVLINWKLKLSFKAVFKFAAYIQILILLCVATKYFSFNFMANILFICVAAVILSFIMRLIDWKTLILVNKKIQNES